MRQSDPAAGGLRRSPKPPIDEVFPDVFQRLDAAMPSCGRRSKLQQAAPLSASLSRGSHGLSEDPMGHWVAFEGGSSRLEVEFRSFFGSAEGGNCRDVGIASQARFPKMRNSCQLARLSQIDLHWVGAPWPVLSQCFGRISVWPWRSSSAWLCWPL